MMAERVPIDTYCEKKIPTLQKTYDGLIDYVDISSVDNTEKKIISYQTIESNGAPSRAKQLLKKGDVLVMLPYDVCSFVQTTGNECVTIIFPPDISEKMMTLVNEAESNNFVHSEDAVAISLEMLKWKGQENSIAFYGYLHVIMEMVTKKGVKVHRTETSFDTAIKYVSDHYREEITLGSVAKKVGVSHEHLSRLFSEKITGGFHRYIQFLRIEYAKQLLSETDKSIGEIMTESGFCDQRTFNRVFKSFTSFTPRQYRNQKEM
jgi:AraC-like DNA-binding protein